MREQARQDQPAGQGGRTGARCGAVPQHGEGGAVRGRQGGDGVRRQLRDEIGDAGVRQAALGRGGPQPHDQVPPRGGGGGDGVQQRGLADALGAAQGDPATGGQPGLDGREE
nr:hypothetical protein GCM10020092_048350 [Actinoplanes digitatis]